MLIDTLVRMGRVADAAAVADPGIDRGLSHLKCVQPGARPPRK